MVGHTGQPRRECKRLHSSKDVLEREEELEEETAVEVHRARHVAQQDQPHLPALAPPELEIDQVPAAEVGAQGPPQVDTPPSGDRPPATAEASGQAPRDLHGEAVDLVELVRRERREVPTAQGFLVGHGGNAERIAALRLFLAAPRLERERFTLLGARGQARVVLAFRRRLNESRQAGAGLTLLTPEEVEGGVERRHLLGPADEHRAEPTAELVAIAHVEHLERAHAVGGLAERDGEAFPPQEGGEADHRAPEVARRHGYGWTGTKGVRPARATSARKRLMSSASLSTQPSVSAMRVSSRWSACSAASACAQSSVSATPGTLLSRTWRNASMKRAISRARRALTPGTLRSTIRTSFSNEG